MCLPFSNAACLATDPSLCMDIECCDAIVIDVFAYVSYFKFSCRIYAEFCLAKLLHDASKSVLVTKTTFHVSINSAKFTVAFNLLEIVSWTLRLRVVIDCIQRKIVKKKKIWIDYNNYSILIFEQRLVCNSKQKWWRIQMAIL